MPPATLRVLLAELIDYAGLFPPASLSMADAVSNYAEYRASADAWALGRFVVPVARLDAFADAAAVHARSDDDAWRVSALMAADPAHDVQVIRRWNAAHRGRVLVDVAEVRASSAAAIAAASNAVDGALTLYIEIPVGDDPMPLITAVRLAGARAKIRTGGIEASAFPSAFEIARFILQCIATGVPFKATAGLHHPLRAEHRLSYADDAPSGTMFGFLNVFLAAALARAGKVTSASELSHVLEERDPRAFVFSDDAVCWRAHRLSAHALSDIRATFASAFGSCSFREPIEDLRHLGLL